MLFCSLTFEQMDSHLKSMIQIEPLMPQCPNDRFKDLLFFFAFSFKFLCHLTALLLIFSFISLNFSLHFKL